MQSTLKTLSPSASVAFAPQRAPPTAASTELAYPPAAATSAPLRRRRRRRRRSKAASGTSANRLVSRQDTRKVESVGDGSSGHVEPETKREGKTGKFLRRFWRAQAGEMRRRSAAVQLRTRVARRLLPTGSTGRTGARRVGRRRSKRAPIQIASRAAIRRRRRRRQGRTRIGGSRDSNSHFPKGNVRTCYIDSECRFAFALVCILRCVSPYIYIYIYI